MPRVAIKVTHMARFTRAGERMMRPICQNRMAWLPLLTLEYDRVTCVNCIRILNAKEKDNGST